MKSSTALFIGVYSTGIVYADRTKVEHGDYARVAFLPYDTLVLRIDAPASPLLDDVRSHASTMQAKRGELFGISTCGMRDAARGLATGQTVYLGKEAS